MTGMQSNKYELFTFTSMKGFTLPVEPRLEIVDLQKSVGGFHSVLVSSKVFFWPPGILFNS
jgi:hypothetical protein